MHYWLGRRVRRFHWYYPGTTMLCFVVVKDRAFSDSLALSMDQFTPDWCRLYSRADATAILDACSS